ncbi:succinate dehydrogenase assembly factor 2 [Wenzhouxiangella sp. AB-CW3]|uniref:FAD assembly factor SdhE n=1 Tax=Wenzhouxiangella sp. AB-CW3 TaxID=2771012 RepID=UPI0021E018B5|nr:succinate dehydrogenase assembly factor 2 [Wenzhouxiangella sp. AB-CW3]
MQELDVLLGRWLATRWTKADAQLQQSFEDLLECEDDRIWDWLMGRDRPEAALSRIIDDIRELGFGPDQR